jgi:hypothetical protein
VFFLSHLLIVPGSTVDGQVCGARKVLLADLAFIFVVAKGANKCQIHSTAEQGTNFNGDIDSVCFVRLAL